jgi:hypothetical protein
MGQRRLLLSWTANIIVAAALALFSTIVIPEHPGTAMLVGVVIANAAALSFGRSYDVPELNLHGE